jgi:hypothetical protein
MRKYPASSKFTSVQWPEWMSDEQHRHLAKEYAYKNEAKSVRKPPTRKGPMFDMRQSGEVGNSNIKKHWNNDQPWMQDFWQIPGLLWLVMNEEEMYLILP